MTVKMEPSEFRWDEREQKLVRTYKNEDSNKDGSIITEVKQTFDKARATTLFGMIKGQKENAEKWYGEQSEIKAVSDDPSKLPNFEEIAMVAKVLNFRNDARTQQQYTEAESNIKLLTSDLEALKKVLPANVQNPQKL